MSFPDYYAILSLQTNATSDQIRTAYKKKSLISHPDRVPAGPGSEIRRKAATVEFQSIADAYYTLSDPARRSSYDRLRASKSDRERTSEASSSGSYFDFFKNAAKGTAGATGGERPDAEFVFGDVFEDMLRPEVDRALPFWRFVGGAAGAAIGFIGGNLPGAAIGGYAGMKLGSVRDAKGKAVYEVFKDLGSDQKAEVLKGLISKVFGMTGIGGAATSGGR